MRRSKSIQLALLVGLAVVCHPFGAAAQTPRWSQPVEVARDALVGGADLDGEGAITAAFELQNGGVVAARRPAGAEAFGAPVRLAGGGARFPAVEVNEPGEALVVWSEAATSHCSFFGCASSLNARLRRPGGSFGPVEPIAEGDAQGSDVAMNDRGDAVVAWQSGESIFGPIRAARRRPGGRFSAGLTLAHTKASRPVVAVGPRGEVAVAWTEYRDPGSDVVVAYSPPNGAFGPPETVWHSAGGDDGFVPAVSIGSDGTLAVAWYTDQSYRTMVSLRKPGGAFGAAKALGPAGPPQFSLDTDGNQLLYWTAQLTFSPPLEQETIASVRAPGGGFPTGSTVPIAAPFDTQMELDGRGNIVAVWTPPERGQHLMATTLRRFGPSEPTQELTTDSTQLTDLSVNRAGAAVALHTVYPNARAQSPAGARVQIVERAADRAAPVLSLGAVALSRATVTATARCNELCRVRGAVSIGGKAGVRRSAGGRTRNPTRVLRARRRGRLTLAISRRDRMRLRAALRRKGTGRVRVGVVAEDPAGNRRVARRTLVVRRP